MDMEMGPVQTAAIEAAAVSLTCCGGQFDACSHDFSNLGKFPFSMPSSPSASTSTTLSLAHLRLGISNASLSSYPATKFVNSVTLADRANLQNQDVLGLDAPARVSTFNTSSGFCASSFTSEQWLQLTYQMFAFKYVAAGMMPPSTVLIGSLNNDSKLGMSTCISLQGAHPALIRGSLDLEPWRCRRTDGKKWRCPKDVVPDKKYCEKHVHRGRNHRARGKIGVSATSLTTGSTVVSTNGLSTDNPYGTYSSLFDCRGARWRAGLSEDVLNRNLSVTNSQSTPAPMIADLLHSSATVAGVTRIHSGDDAEHFFSESNFPALDLAKWCNKTEAEEQDMKRSKSARVAGKLDDSLGLGSGHLGLAIKREDQNPSEDWFRGDWTICSAALGGPLAEALQCRGGEGLINLEERWDAGRRREALMSPSNVLCSRSAFGGSSSESSSGASSPLSLMKRNWDGLIN